MFLVMKTYLLSSNSTK